MSWWGNQVSESVWPPSQKHSRRAVHVYVCIDKQALAGLPGLESRLWSALGRFDPIVVHVEAMDSPGFELYVSSPDGGGGAFAAPGVVQVEDAVADALSVMLLAGACQVLSPEEAEVKR